MCTLRHADVWRLTSRLLPKFVAADHYRVYVPDNEVAQFATISDRAFEVVSQASLGHDYVNPLRDSLRAADNWGRHGWYQQQFFKIEALLRSSEENLVIWDADCVPTRSIPMFDEAGFPLYMKASEFNQNYFDCIEEILGLHRVQDTSFVIPGFPMKREWLTEFREYVEDRHGGTPWFDVLIDCTDFKLRAGFSETETLGTWVANMYPESWASIPLEWERFGQSRFGYARSFEPDEVVELGAINGLDIISFENWDPRGWRRIGPWVRSRLNL